jgi:IMP dehydrogenase
MGVPQITAIMEAKKGVAGTKTTIIADGGIRQMGDIAKAIAAGADAVMLGSMLAGFSESPGEQMELNGQLFKKYRGMGSLGAMKKGGAERYGQNMQSPDKKLIAEGVEGMVPFKGSGEDFLYQVAGSLKSSFYYIGAGRTCLLLRLFLTGVGIRPRAYDWRLRRRTCSGRRTLSRSLASREGE